MAKRVQKIEKPIKDLGDSQVKDWDFMTLMNTNLKELEVRRSLKRLGDLQVMTWDFKTVLPTVKKAANQEVDLVDLIKRAANFKVMDWDFRKPNSAEFAPAVPALTTRSTSRADLPAITLRLKNFLLYVVVNLINEPSQAEIKVSEIGPDVLRFKLLLANRDLTLLIGREGHTAAAIRNILKAAGASYAVQVLLQIHSHEEETAQLAKAAKHS